MGTESGEERESRLAPFKRIDESPNFLELCKMVILGCTLMPLRLVLIITVLTIYFIVMNILVMFGRYHSLDSQPK